MSQSEYNCPDLAEKLNKVQTLYREYQSALPENGDSGFTTIKQLDESGELEKAIIEIEESTCSIFLEDLVEKKDFSISEYRNVFEPKNIDGKVAYRAQKDDGRWVIVFDGKESPVSYKQVGYPQNIDGKVAYRAQKDNDVWVGVVGDREIKIDGDIKSLDVVKN
jgi:hypothetical protein